MAAAALSLDQIYRETLSLRVPLSQRVSSFANSAIEVAKFRTVMRWGHVLKQERFSRAGVAL